MHDHAAHTAHAVTALTGLWPLMTAMFLTGLAGGFGHCASMCGPFVLAQVAGAAAAQGRGADGVVRSPVTPMAMAAACAGVPGGGDSPRVAARVGQACRFDQVAGQVGQTGRAAGAPMPVLVRARGGVLLPYHLGRLTTYAVLGGVMAGLSGLIVSGTGFRWLLGAVLGFAALLFLGQAAKGFARWIPALGLVLRAPAGMGVAARLSAVLARPLRPLLADPRGGNGYLLGLALGLLPCGFLYAGLASAVGTGSALGGVLVMAAFALGTMPALVTVGVLGSVAGARWTRLMQAVAPPLMLFNAGVVGLMAWHALGP